MKGKCEHFPLFFTILNILRFALYGFFVEKQILNSAIASLKPKWERRVGLFDVSVYKIQPKIVANAACRFLFFLIFPGGGIPPDPLGYSGPWRETCPYCANSDTISFGSGSAPAGLKSFPIYLLFKSDPLDRFFSNFHNILK